MRNHCLCLIAAVAVSVGGTAVAQTPASDNVGITNWWQVEVIMFTQGNNWATTAEVWPTDVELAYPDQWQTITPLVDPNTNSEETSEPGTAVNDGFLDPGIIKLIPATELQLTDLRQRLDRGRRRILFHGGWRQYMERDRAEAPIIFTAGDQYDDHYELEGSIHLYVQRYLHFNTNLWLTEFSINSGQERLPWPELPRRPNMEDPLSLAALDRPDDDLTNSYRTDGSQYNTYQSNSGAINTLEWLDQRGNTTFYDSRYDEILSRNYLVNNLALIQQNRPMRSDELHYIDHPLLGILVKITRYQPPEPAGGGVDPLDELLGPKPE